MSEHLSQHVVKLPHKELCLCVFNRATYARCKTLIYELSKQPHISLTVILSSALLMEEFGNAADEYIKSSHEGNVQFELIDIGYSDFTPYGMAKAASRVWDRLTDFFHAHNFDAVIVVADRFETLPAAAAASYLNIPVIHIQGGETTGNLDDRIRHAVTKLSDYHFVSTDLAKSYVEAMGEDSKRVKRTGCPSIDLLRVNRIRRFRTKERYILCIFHPETDSNDEAYEQTKVVLESVLEFCMQFGYRCYWFYPNPDPGRQHIVRLLDEVLSANKAFLVKAINKDPVLFLRQFAAASFFIGNSSCGIRESSYLGLPAIDVGDRQAYRERAHNVISCPYDKDYIRAAMVKQRDAYRHPISRLYGVGKAGEAITEAISLTEFTLKPTLTYPFTMKFKEKHFGEGRFKLHEKTIAYVAKQFRQGSRDSADSTACERVTLPSES